MTRHGFGQVFDGRDPMSLAAALSEIETHYESYKQAIDSTDLTPYTWKSQVDTLLDVYQSAGVTLR